VQSEHATKASENDLIQAESGRRQNNSLAGFFIDRKTGGKKEREKRKSKKNQSKKVAKVGKIWSQMP